jgi:hypothetical protein
MILWIVINDFIECPEKYDWQTILKNEYETTTGISKQQRLQFDN